MPGVVNIPLRKMASAIARQLGHDGAIIITKSSDGFYHVGLSGLTDREIQNALCIGIHCNFSDMDARSNEAESEN